METSSLHEGFAGYTAQPVREADLFIRERISARLGVILARMDGCVEKCREHRSIKLCSEVGVMAKKCESILSECGKDPSSVLDEALAADLARSRTTAGYEKIMEADDAIERGIAICEGMTCSMTCVETDTHIIETIARIDRALNEIRKGLRERARHINAVYMLNPGRKSQ